MEKESNPEESEASKLTSKMGNVNRKPPTSSGDSVPSSSTDTNKLELNAPDSDANASISSTSNISSQVSSKHISDIDKEADLFATEYNLDAISADKITENVDDIVTDLENLLGEKSSQELRQETAKIHEETAAIQEQDVKPDVPIVVKEEIEYTEEEETPNVVVKEEIEYAENSQENKVEQASDTSVEIKEVKEEIEYSEDIEKNAVPAETNIVEANISHEKPAESEESLKLSQDSMKQEISDVSFVSETTEPSMNTEESEVSTFKETQVNEISTESVDSSPMDFEESQKSVPEVKEAAQDDSEDTKMETDDHEITEEEISSKITVKPQVTETISLQDDINTVAQDHHQIEDTLESNVKCESSEELISAESPKNDESLCESSEKLMNAESPKNDESLCESSEELIKTESHKNDESLCESSEEFIKAESPKNNESLSKSYESSPETSSEASQSEPLSQSPSEQCEIKTEEIEIKAEAEENLEDELLKAALEASRRQNLKVFEQKQTDVATESQPAQSSVENVLEIDLIKAAQECQSRDECYDDPEVRQVQGQSSEAAVTTENESENERIRMEKILECPKLDYRKPLNIVVENTAEVKEAESTTVEDVVEVKESSDEDKEAEYSSKISGQSQELKLTIRKTKGDDSSILKIYDPQETVVMPQVVEVSPSESETEPEDSSLPRIVIKHPQQGSPKILSPLKITIKPIVKPEDLQHQKSSPKLKIKPIVKPDEEPIHHHSPKITIKPIPKPEELVERSSSPKITIKPLLKPVEVSASPKIKIKPIVKPPQQQQEESSGASVPQDEERIVLKISKNSSSNVKVVDDSEKSLAKIKLKFSMDGGHAHIVNETQKNDDGTQETNTAQDNEEKHAAKKPRLDLNAAAAGGSNITSDESLTSSNQSTIEDSQAAGVPAVAVVPPVQEVPVVAPRKRGRPRKVPLEVRRCGVEDEPVVLEEATSVASRSGRPKRSCQRPSVRDTLGMKPRRPRRGRGAKVPTMVMVLTKEQKRQSKLKVLKEAAITAQVSAAFEQPNFDDSPAQHQMDKHSSFLGDSLCVNLVQSSVIEESLQSLETHASSSDVVMYEEETRMSADINSRAQTPAKQVSTPLLGPDMVVEESQSSVLSTATTESVKLKKATKMEIEPEGEVISADQLAEYYWGGGGPYMLQEQVAQFLGIKSFKRKYPGIKRRMVDMQERDFIRESGLASEHLCDLGLTAVNSADILDLMYSDFQCKYEEYCKHQRDRQTKDITNKQKALSLAASQEKTKLDIVQQAVESASQWNHNFNRTRREQRRACMDLQTFTINYPKGSRKQAPRPKIGHYPIALVPGQYTDYYKNYTPTELNNLPLNTMLYHAINIPHEEDSQSDGSGTESDSSSSGSDSTDSESSEDDCNLCEQSPGVNNVKVKEREISQQLRQLEINAFLQLFLL